MPKHRMTDSRKVLTLSMKRKILAEVDKGRKKTEICEEYSIAKSTLSTYIKDRSKIEDTTSTNEPKRKRARVAKNDDLENVLFRWFQQARASSIPISGPILCTKANEIAAEMNISDFSSNTGWLDRFKKRFGIVYKTISGEAASVDKSSVEKWKDGELKRIMDKYEPKDIYNADETGLFYRCLPNKTHTLKGENCVGGKNSKDRLTVLVAANMDGSDKLEPVVIGRFSKPRCFSNVKKIPLPYYANRRSWMTSTIYESWLRKLDTKLCSQGRKIAMIVDNCPAHPEIADLQAIEVIKLPPNATALLQPCDQGIIASLKRHYRASIMQKLLLHIDDGRDITTFKISVLDAIYDLRIAWNRVTPITIQNCFNHSGFIVSGSDNSPDTAEDFGNIFEKMSRYLPPNHTPDSYLSIDDEVITCEVSSVQDIIHDFMGSDAVDHDDVDDDEIISPPSSKKAREAVTTLRSFLASQGNDNYTDILGELSLYINKVSIESRKQCLITDFFKVNI